MYICANCLEKEAVWTNMAGKFEWCDNCVPRGCSCNDISVNYYPGQEDDQEEFEYQCDCFRDEVLHNNVILIDYEKNEHCCGKEIKKITDKKEIKELINNCTDEKLMHLTAIPLDDHGKEYPCVEIEPKRNFSVIQKNEVFYSMIDKSFFLADQRFKHHTKAYPIKNDVSQFLCEYNGIDDVSGLELDFENPKWFDNQGIDYMNKEIELLMTTYDVYSDKNNLFDFLNTFIYSNQKINSNYENLFKDLKEYFDFDDDEYSKDIRSLNDKKIKRLIKFLILFHRYNEVIKGESKPSVYKMTIRRKKIFKKIFNLIY